MLAIRRVTALSGLRRQLATPKQLAGGRAIAAVFDSASIDGGIVDKRVLHPVIESWKREENVEECREAWDFKPYWSVEGHDVFKHQADHSLNESNHLQRFGMFVGWSFLWFWFGYGFKKEKLRTSTAAGLL